MIRSRQQGYYDALGQADQLGELGPFVAYQLAAIHEALQAQTRSEMGPEIDRALLLPLAAEPSLSALQQQGHQRREGSPCGGRWQAL